MKKKIAKVLKENRTTHQGAPWLWIPASDNWIEILSDKIKDELEK